MEEKRKSIFRKLLAVSLVLVYLGSFVSAQTGMLGNDTAGLIGITKDIISYIPELVDLVIEIVPLLFIFMFVGWLTGLFDGILDMMNMGGLKPRR